MRVDLLCGRLPPSERLPHLRELTVHLCPSDELSEGSETSSEGSGEGPSESDESVGWETASETDHVTDSNHPSPTLSELHPNLFGRYVRSQQGSDSDHSSQQGSDRVGAPRAHSDDSSQQGSDSGAFRSRAYWASSDDSSADSDAPWSGSEHGPAGTHTRSTSTASHITISTATTVSVASSDLPIYASIAAFLPQLTHLQITNELDHQKKLPWSHIFTSTTNTLTHFTTNAWLTDRFLRTLRSHAPKLEYYEFESWCGWLKRDHEVGRWAVTTARYVNSSEVALSGYHLMDFPRTETVATLLPGGDSVIEIDFKVESPNRERPRPAVSVCARMRMLCLCTCHHNTHGLCSQIITGQTIACL